jgi:alpha-1,6-mannosyltransferase
MSRTAAARPDISVPPAPARLAGAYLLLAALLALPPLLHARRLLEGGYAFYLSYWTGAAPPDAWLRLADSVWIALCLGGMALLAERLGAGPPRPWLAAAAGCCLALAPPFGSADAFYYFHMVRGWVEAGADPYVTPFTVLNPHLGEGPMATRIEFIPYPPGWVLLAAGLYRLAGGAFWAFVLALKALGAAAYAVAAAALMGIDRALRPGARDGGAAALYLASPFFLLEGLSQMHFDLVWLALVLVAARLVLARRTLAAAAVWGAAFWIKYTAVFALPVFLPVLLDGTVPLRRRLAALGAGAGIAAALGAAAGAPFAGWEAILGGAARLNGWPFNSPAVLAHAVGAGGAATALSAALLAGAAAALWFGRPAASPRTMAGALEWAAAGCLAYLLVASPVYWPWYALWPYLFTLASGRRTLLAPCRLLVWLSFAHYPLLYVVGHLQASFDREFQLLYVALTRVPVLLLWLGAGSRSPVNEPASRRDGEPAIR